MMKRPHLRRNGHHVARERFVQGGAKDHLKVRHRNASSRSISACSAPALSAHVGR
jgi:hypothetical protein